MKQMLDPELSRRSFLEAALAAGGGVGALGSGTLSAAAASAARPALRQVPPERIEPLLTFHGDLKRMPLGAARLEAAWEGHQPLRCSGNSRCEPGTCGLCSAYSTSHE